MQAIVPALTGLAKTAGAAFLANAAQGISEKIQDAAGNAGRRVGDNVGNAIGSRIESFGQLPGDGQARFLAVTRATQIQDPNAQQVRQTSLVVPFDRQSY